MSADEERPNIANPPSDGAQLVAFKPKTVGIGMTSEEYERMRTKIKKEVTVNHTSSLWVALGLAAASVFAALWIAVLSTDMQAAPRGKFEVAAWGFAGVAVMFFIIHLVRWKDASDRADDLLDDIEAMCQRVDVQPEPPRVEVNTGTSSAAPFSRSIDLKAAGIRLSWLPQDAARREDERAAEAETSDQQALERPRLRARLPRPDDPAGPG